MDVEGECVMTVMTSCFLYGVGVSLLLLLRMERVFKQIDLLT